MWRFSFLPLHIRVGAKRPQHLAWNLVVLSLWGIVSLSALTALAMQRADRFVLGDARAWMLWALILMGLVNYLPTGNRLAALLVAVGQVILFAASAAAAWRRISHEFAGWTELGVVSVCHRRGRARTGSSPLRGQKEIDPFDRLWLDFRDSFGLLWGLRLQERVNAASTAAKWDVELQWHGFPAKGVPAKHREAMRQAMTGLLRRFVSHEWIAARLETGRRLNLKVNYATRERSALLHALSRADLQQSAGAQSAAGSDAGALALELTWAEALDAIVKEASNALQCERALLYQYDPKRESLFTTAGTEVPVHLKIDQGIAGYVARQRSW